LPPESAWELLQALVGDAPEIAPLKHRLIETTEGNPLFLEESVRTLVETGALAGERGAYRLTRPVKYLEIPATVQAILAARIDRLAPEGKHLLQAAAVVGNDVPMPFLLAIAEAREDAVRAGLGRLQTAEFLYERRLFPDLEYSSASVAGRPRSFLLSAPSPPAARRRTSTTRSALVVKPSIWPSSSACAPSSPTATSGSASYTGAWVTASRPRSTSLPPRRCTARWTCGSGWSRRRRGSRLILNFGFARVQFSRGLNVCGSTPAVMRGSRRRGGGVRVLLP
jgi:hypothetical protein